MNFLDTYDIARSTTPNPEAPEQPSLNEEVNQVIGQLGRFWGGFRKQSQTALETARKDLSQVVSQAQKEFSKLTAAETSTESGAESAATKDDDAAAPNTAEGSSTDAIAESSTTATRDGASAQPSSSSASISSSGSTGSLLWGRLQAALPPNIVSTVQNSIPESLKHASENIDLQQIRTTMLAELQRVQGVTLAQAEEYAHKSEALLREAVKEAGEVLRDAVKVLPPESQADDSGAGGSGLLWDGSDIWMLPGISSDSASGSGKEREGRASTSSFRAGAETQNAVASRAEALLRRLATDPSIIRHDPEVDEGAKDQYGAWKEKEVDTLDGGVDGAAWKNKIEAALQDSANGQALKQLEETLVPSELTESAFWLRFFFRQYQIRSEEEKRKALLQSTTSENDEDFSWEDEEDDPTSPVTTGSKPTQSPTDTPRNVTTKDSEQKVTLAVPAAGLGTGGTSSPRVSSEDSFDMISANVSVAGDDKPTSTAKSKAAKEDDEADSDWE
ncbi:hypothetical protein CPC08DRAFT_683666 [Agrocybe pediades]|nr:hypothetical protein CPC08DRAFT_683666 [Agrocybe pediades]